MRKGERKGRWAIAVLIVAMLSGCGKSTSSVPSTVATVDGATPSFGATMIVASTTTVLPTPTSLAVRPTATVAPTPTPLNFTPPPTRPPVAASGTVTCGADTTAECFWQAYQRCDTALQAMVKVTHPSTTDPGGNIGTRVDQFTIEQNGITCAILDHLGVDIVQPSGTHGGAGTVGLCTTLSYDRSNHVLHFAGCSLGDMDIAVP